MGFHTKAFSARGEFYTVFTAKADRFCDGWTFFKRNVYLRMGASGCRMERHLSNEKVFAKVLRGILSRNRENTQKIFFKKSIFDKIWQFWMLFYNC